MSHRPTSPPIMLTLNPYSYHHPEACDLTIPTSPHLLPLLALHSAPVTLGLSFQCSNMPSASQPQDLCICCPFCFTVWLILPLHSGLNSIVISSLICPWSARLNKFPAVFLLENVIYLFTYLLSGPHLEYNIHDLWDLRSGLYWSLKKWLVHWGAQNIFA